MKPFDFLTLDITSNDLPSQAHTGPISQVTYSPGCVVTLGEDDKLCVWERHQV